VVITAAHTDPACPSTNVRSQSFPKRKTVHSTCRALSQPQILQLYLFTTPLIWNVTLSEHTYRRRSGDMSILSSMSTAKFVCATWSLSFSAFESHMLLGGAFCVAHHALLNMEFVTAS
jgi:hypothetical protein